MPGFFDKLLGKDDRGKVQSIGYLGNMKDEASRKKLITFLEGENAEVRAAAAGALEQHFTSGDVKAIAALTKVLDDPDAGVRKRAALSLGGFIVQAPEAGESKAAKQAIIALLKRETDEGVIKNAIISLANVQDASLTNPIAEALRGKDKKVVSMAIDAINDLPPTDIRLDMKKALRSAL
ncbi:MAG TPA: HEAT repeat domain-containing protein [Methanocella sp.]|uniref:HEAT repeat domain-containing protein n=1 Tax=Methanocella sp. TaxID=2052833 RepID=UPI002B6E7B9B|nr:HEAT repeat domain-containing protein [Methanocella sp.]HTY90952.1 HEAT repeat domain-containing protein [Methanocella sp.]